MGVSTLALTLWRKVPILTAWSTPGAALLVSGLQGVTLAQAIGVFIFANGLIVLCGVTGLFARLMKIIPHSLAAAMLAGILLRFGMQAFSSLQGNLLLCGSMLAAWLICKVCLPRFAVVAAMLAGSAVAALSGDVTGSQISWRFVAPAFIAPEFTPALLLSVGVPFFLVTMASQNAPGFATLQASGYRVPASSLIVATGGLAPHVLRNLLAWIEENLDRPLTLADLAQEAALSEYHFARMFRQSMKMAPHQYVMQRRMVKAQALITRLLKWLALLKPQAIAISVNGSRLRVMSACALTIRRCITY